MSDDENFFVAKLYCGMDFSSRVFLMNYYFLGKSGGKVKVNKRGFNLKYMFDMARMIRNRWINFFNKVYFLKPS